MNRLPKVIQLEIWEYVRGDRTFWRREFRNCVHELGQPRHVRHFVDSECSPTTRQFFETFDPEDFPINNPPKSQMPGSSGWKRPLRFTTKKQFRDGILWLGSSDLIDSIIFPFVPGQVLMRFEDEIPILLHSVGNHLKFPWIPAWSHQGVSFRVEHLEDFSCEVVHTTNLHARVMWDFKFAMTTTFQLGTDMFTIQYAGRRARVTKRPLVRDISIAKKQDGWLSRLATIFHF